MFVLQLGRNHKPIFTIQDEPPTWPSDTDEFMGLESISEPDDMDVDENNDNDKVVLRYTRQYTVIVDFSRCEWSKEL